MSFSLPSKLGVRI